MWRWEKVLKLSKPCCPEATESVGWVTKVQYLSSKSQDILQSTNFVCYLFVFCGAFFFICCQFVRGFLFCFLLVVVVVVVGFFFFFFLVLFCIVLRRVLRRGSTAICQKTANAVLIQYTTTCCIAHSV